MCVCTGLCLFMCLGVHVSAQAVLKFCQFLPIVALKNLGSGAEPVGKCGLSFYLKSAELRSFFFVQFAVATSARRVISKR